MRIVGSFLIALAVSGSSGFAADLPSTVVFGNDAVQQSVPYSSRWNVAQTNCGGNSCCCKPRNRKGKRCIPKSRCSSIGGTCLPAGTKCIN